MNPPKLLLETFVGAAMSLNIIYITLNLGSMKIAGVGPEAEAEIRAKTEFIGVQVGGKVMRDLTAEGSLGSRAEEGPGSLSVRAQGSEDPRKEADENQAAGKEELPSRNEILHQLQKVRLVLKIVV